MSVCIQFNYGTKPFLDLLFFIASNVSEKLKTNPRLEKIDSNLNVIQNPIIQDSIKLTTCHYQVSEPELSYALNHFVKPKMCFTYGEKQDEFFLHLSEPNTTKPIMDKSDFNYTLFTSYEVRFEPSSFAVFEKLMIAAKEYRKKYYYFDTMSQLQQNLLRFFDNPKEAIVNVHNVDEQNSDRLYC